MGDDASEHLHTQPGHQENSRMERIKGEKTSLKTRLETACRVWLMQGGHQGTGSPLLCTSLTLLSLFDLLCHLIENGFYLGVVWGLAVARRGEAVGICSLVLWTRIRIKMI